MIAQSRILVVGGKGLIGSAFSESVAHDKVVFVLHSDGHVYRRKEDGLFDFVLEAHSKSDSFKTFLASIGIIVYCAGSMVPATNISLDNVSDMLFNDVVDVVALAMLAKTTGVPKFVYLSSGGALYDESCNECALPFMESDGIKPTSFYGVSKFAVEGYLDLLTSPVFSVVTLRVANPYSDVLKSSKSQGVIPIIIHKALRGETLLVYGDGTATRDYVHLDDVVKAIHAACIYQGTESCFNVGTGVGFTILEVVMEIESAVGKKINIAFDAARSTDKYFAVVNPAKANVELCWKATIDLKEGIRRCVKSISHRA